MGAVLGYAPPERGAGEDAGDGEREGDDVGPTRVVREDHFREEHADGEPEDRPDDSSENCHHRKLTTTGCECGQGDASYGFGTSSSRPT